MLLVMKIHGIGRMLASMGVVILLTSVGLGQTADEDVDNLTITELSATEVRLDWVSSPADACTLLTYSVFRSTDEGFAPSSVNRIAKGIKGTRYIAHEIESRKTFFYHVRAVRPNSCEGLVPKLPAMSSGRMAVFPLDLNSKYFASAGDTIAVCTATSTTEISCPDLGYFHAAIASQGQHEYLIGCLVTDYESGAWNCVDLGSNSYYISIHSQTLTVLNSGFKEVITTTGRSVKPVTPVFSILARLK